MLICTISFCRSSRASYGDDAVGYVQLKREGHLCILYAVLTPEHKVRQKGYTVTASIDEEEKIIVDCHCEDCAASEGGCKHGIAFLFWIFRRSVLPSVTSVECYWKKSALAKVGTTIKGELIKDIFKTTVTLPDVGNSFLNEIVNCGKANEVECVLLDFYKDNLSTTERLSLYHLHLRFIKSGLGSYDANSFIEFCRNNIDNLHCEQAVTLTKNQAKNSKWFDLRFARITASKIYEVAHCQTLEGSLTQAVLGATKFTTTDAMKRGIQLEEQVLKVVASQKRIKIQKVGLYINPKDPIFGASPDGVSDEFCLEVKCPMKESTFRNYIKDGKITPKPFAQIQLQMYLTRKKKGLFCVASPNFEESNEVFIIEVQFDETYCNNLMSQALEFWKKAIFPILNK